MSKKDKKFNGLLLVIGAMSLTALTGCGGHSSPPPPPPPTWHVFDQTSTPQIWLPDTQHNWIENRVYAGKFKTDTTHNKTPGTVNGVPGVWINSTTTTYKWY